jgi:hypothetical protein
MKKNTLYAEAERLYIQGQCTFDEIASRLECAEKTIRLWADEGLWREKRAKFLQQKETLHEKLYEFLNSLMDTIKADWAEGNKVDPGRMFALGKLLDKMEKAKKFEQARSDESSEKDPTQGLDDEQLQMLEKQLGITL